MAYTKYSLTPANNTAAPPDGAPEGMLPSAVNDTMRDMMAQIRDCGDGVRDGTYTMTAVKITGGTITGVTLTGNTFSSPVISGGTINNATIGATTATTGKFSTLTNSALTSGRITYAGASGLLSDSATLTYNGTTLTATTGANFCTTSGSVGIGTSSPNRLLSLYATQPVFQITNVASGNTQGTIQYQESGATNFILDNQGSGSGGAIVFQQAGSERMRIDASGNLLVGTTDSGSTSGNGFKITSGSGNADAISVVTGASTNAGLTTYQLYSTGAGAYRFYVGASGTIFATSTVITAISDQRLKENVRDIDTGLDAIMALKPRRFDWKEGKGQDKKDVAGFIAQEFEDVFPECVSTSKAGADGIEYKNINHETLIPTLVKAIQELKAEFDAYKATHP